MPQLTGATLRGEYNELTHSVMLTEGVRHDAQRPKCR